ncbi:class I lanthipeptide [Chryseobacterium paridis]|uniref:Class I lanthipeptide n=1 Tax=Chryseobacterium paridis TaxID=2800328 RepID=A0ABS1FYR2_9FLAO|nr:class I lanthipeptide [Chryseobacterium paridis]MBK1897532.1 class I lanthipeptide [Chryseobacterium paridis]
MKKLKLNKGLQINKEAISKLQDEQIKNIKGGAAAGSCGWKSCNTTVVTPPTKTIVAS